MATNFSDLLADAMKEDIGNIALKPTVDPHIPHVPIVLLIDVSSSMEGAPINAVNAHLTQFFNDVANGTSETSEKMRQYGDFSVITYGGRGAEVIVPWTHGSQLQPMPALSPSGGTPMGAAIIKAGELLLDRFRGYNRDQTVEVMCGAVFNLTDGAPTDMDPTTQIWKAARAVMEMFEFAGSSGRSYVQFFQLGAPGYDSTTLEALSVRPGRVFSIGTDMAEFFKFIKLSLSGLRQYATIEAAINAALANKTP